MRHYFRLMMAWLALGLALLVGILVVVGGLRLEVGGHAPNHLGEVALIAGVPWLGFGIVMAAVSYRYEGTRFHTQGAGVLASGLNMALLGVILASVLRLTFGFVPGFQELEGWMDGFMFPLWRVGNDLLDHVGLPGAVGPVDLAPILIIVVLLLSRSAVTWSQGLLTPSEARPSYAPQPKDDRGRKRSSAKARAAARKVAVASYSEAKALLADTEVELTFLALDVVGSTNMKVGEDPFIIEQSFTDYRKLVERMLRRHGAHKQTWTPDGQMAAFRSAQSAVDCGRDILLALPDFNRNTSKMSKPFRLRVGANTAVVSSDDDTPMEEMSDFEIDVAGHMQKYADHDTIWISEATFEQLANRSGFKAIEKQVDGRQVYAWERPT